MSRANHLGPDRAEVFVRSLPLDAQLTNGHHALASFAHELALVHERHSFALANSGEVAEIEDRLVATWRDFIELSALNFDGVPRMEGPNASRH